MSYLPVSSNDTLSHLALPSSPETLCGKLAIDGPTASNYLTCDVCHTLSSGDSILKQTKKIEAGRACPHCEDGFDPTGNACWNCGGTGWLDEGDSDFTDYLQGIDTEFPRGSRVASAVGSCVNCGSTYTKDGKSCADCGQLRDASNVRDMPQEGPGGIERIPAPVVAPASPEEYDPVKAYLAQGETSRQSNVEKIATNWTRDGDRIENGFEVVISKEQAARTPFLDLTRVSVSEKRECPDCNETHWLSKIASCTDCDGLKCNSCMETISLGGFLGTCKKCAGTESDDIYEADYEDAQGDEQSAYLSYLMAEDEAETDTLFLPYDSE